MIHAYTVRTMRCNLPHSQLFLSTHLDEPSKQACAIVGSSSCYTRNNIIRATCTVLYDCGMLLVRKRKRYVAIINDLPTWIGFSPKPVVCCSCSGSFRFVPPTIPYTIACIQHCAAYALRLSYCHGGLLFFSMSYIYLCHR